MTDVHATLLGFFNGLADVANPPVFNVTYRLAGGTPVLAEDTMTVDSFEVVLPSMGEQFVPGSVVFEFGDKIYTDRNGQLYHSIDPSNGNGIFGGTLDYATGKVSLQTWTVGLVNSGMVLSSLTTGGYNPVSKVVLRTPQVPLRPSSFQVRAALVSGGFVSASSNDDGAINSANIVGTIDNDTGIAVLGFGSWVTVAGHESESWFDPANVENGKIFKPAPVLAETVVYNAVSYTFLPLEARILGLDPARLPIDGRIPVYHKGDIIIILNDQTTTLTAQSNTATDLGRIRLSRVSVVDLGKNPLPAGKWNADLDTGIVTWGDLSGVSQPLAITDRIQDMAVVSDVQINGRITLSTPLTHNYPADTSLVSSAVVFNDIYAQATNPFDQQTWTNVWEDVLIGNQTIAQYNYTAHPIGVTNAGAIEERWVILFQTNSTVNVIGEHVGQILSGYPVGNDIAPINPATGDPYFTLKKEGFGQGWAAGNLLRFNTYQAAKPLWIIESVLQGQATSPDYRFCISFSGDVDAP